MTGVARAAVFDAPGEPFTIRSYDLRAVRPGEVLVRNRLSTICRSDIHSWEGKRPSPCPGLLGHEIIGTIEALGADVAADLRGETLAVGDRVTWTEYFGCGRCRFCVIHPVPVDHRSAWLGKEGIMNTGVVIGFRVARTVPENDEE